MAWNTKDQSNASLNSTMLANIAVSTTIAAIATQRQG